MPPLRHDSITKGSLKRKCREYKSATTQRTKLRLNEDVHTADGKDGQPSSRPALLPAHEACLSCKETGTECIASPGRPCAACFLKVGEGTPCLRNSIHDIFASGIPGLGSEEWLLPTTGGVPLQIRMKYLDDARRIRDLDDFTSEHDSIVNRKDAIAAFVEQFQNIDERWHNSLDPTTVDIIKACVTIQCSILEDDGRTWCLLADSNTVIATALWTLAMARQITEVEGTVTTVSVRKFCENKSLEPDIEEWDGLVLEISRAETEAGQTKPKESKLPALVAEIHRITLKMFLQRRLQDLPVILCVLCLMRLILTCFHGACFYHPLVKNWDKSAYEEALGEENAISVSYFEILHVAWIESGFEHHCNTEPLASRLEAFVFADLFFLKEDSD